MLIAKSMFTNNGQRGPTREQRRMLVVLDRMAAAMRHGLPLTTALRALLQERGAQQVLSSGRWRARTARLIDDLESGRALSEAVEQHLGAWLPRHVVHALAEAECRGNLDRALPLLVANTRASLTAAGRCRTVLVYPVVQFTTVFTLLSGLMLFIVPKFFAIFDEMLPGSGSPALPLRMVMVAHRWVVLLVPMVLTVALLVQGIRFVRFLLRLPRWSWIGILSFLFGLRRRLGLLEAASALSGLLAAGLDVAAAARQAASLASSRWAQRRLTAFATALDHGQAWADAWQALGIGTPLTDWLVRNAAARERPQDGFQAVTEWAADDIDRFQRRIVRWTEPAANLVNGLCVGGIVYAMASALFSVLLRMASF